MREKNTIAALLLAFLNLFPIDPISAEELVFCRPNNMVSAHAYIAEERGFFGELALDVRFEPATNAKICLDSLIAGRADVLMGAESAFVYITPAKPEASILAVTQRNPETALFYRTDREIQSIADLKGRAIGYLPGSCSVPYLALSLEKAGVKWDEVRLVPLSPPALTQALVGGAVDAISIWEPWGSNALNVLKEKGGVIRDSELYSFHSLLISSREITRTRKEELKKLLLAYLKAEDFMRSQPEQSQEILARRLALDRSVLEALWNQYDFRVGLRGETLELLRKDFEILRRTDRNFVGVNVPEMTDFFDRSFLLAISPERVSEYAKK